jgi:hypothetical protein
MNRPAASRGRRSARGTGSLATGRACLAARGEQRAHCAPVAGGGGGSARRRHGVGFGTGTRFQLLPSHRSISSLVTWWG